MIQRSSTQAIDYSLSLFYFKGTRKHLFKDQDYHIFIFKDRILMGQSMQDQKPKYNIPINLSQKISWVVSFKQKRVTIQAFSFQHKDQEKTMYANHKHLAEYKDFKPRFNKLLSCKVTFFKIADFYELQFIIGKGGSAKVFQCRNLSDNRLFAIKAIGKDYLSASEYGYVQRFINNIKTSFHAEVQILKQLSELSIPDQKYFIKLFDVFQGNLTFYLVTELMQGKTLQNEINHYKDLGKRMPYDQVKTIMLHLLEGVKIMHKQHVKTSNISKLIHRDIKPDNIMFEKLDRMDTLKIVDFGLATRTDVDAYQFPKCGTPGYVAPEILNMKQKNFLYSEVCDIFSCGAIFYKLYILHLMISLSGKNVFTGSCIDDVLKKNKQCQIDFHREDINHIDQFERQLLQALLQKDPTYRVSAEKALQYDYFVAKKSRVSIKQFNLFRSQKHSSVLVKAQPQQLPQSLSVSQSLPPLITPPISLKQIDLNPDQNVKLKQISENDISPFQRQSKMRGKSLFFPQKSQQVTGSNQKQNQPADDAQSFDSMNEHTKKDIIQMNQLPLFKRPNSSALSIVRARSQDDKYNQVLTQLSQNVTKMLSNIRTNVSDKKSTLTQQLSSQNRPSIENFGSFYMKDPLSNLIKHNQQISLSSNNLVGSGLESNLQQFSSIEPQI